MPNKWQTSVLIPNFIEKEDVRNFNACLRVKLLENVKCAE